MMMNLTTRMMNHFQTTDYRFTTIYVKFNSFAQGSKSVDRIGLDCDPNRGSDRDPENSNRFRTLVLQQFLSLASRTIFSSKLLYWADSAKKSFSNYQNEVNVPQICALAFDLFCRHR